MAALGEVPFGRYYGTRRRHAAVRRPRRRLLRAHRRPRLHRVDLAATSSAPSPGSTTTATCDGDGFVEYARRSQQRPDPPGLEGLGRLRLPRRRHAWPRGPSPCARSRATSTPPARQAPSSPRVLGQPERAAAPGAPGRGAAGAVRAAPSGARISAPTPWRSTARSGRCEVRSLQRRPLPLLRHRQPAERAWRVADSAARRILLLGLGHPHPRRQRGALQPDVLPQRLGLAARQRPDRRMGMARYGRKDGAAKVLAGAVRGQPALRPAPHAGAVLRLPPRAGEGPTLYPVACAPQAWAAGSVFLLLQACLGLDIDAPKGGSASNAPSSRRPRPRHPRATSGSAKPASISSSSATRATSGSTWRSGTGRSRWSW